MPPPPDAAAAQDRVDRIRAFRDEIAELERDGILHLSPEQLGAIERYHAAVRSSVSAQFSVDVTDTERRLSLGMRIAALVGAAALCAAVVLFVYRVWGLMAPIAQVALLTAAPLAGLALTALAARLDRTKYFASIMGAVALGAFLADLQGMQDAFGLTPSPHVYLAWAAYGALVAYAFGLRLVFAGAVLCLIAWASATMTYAAGGPFAEIGDVPEHLCLAGAVGFAASWLPAHRRHGFAAICRGIGASVMLLTLLALGHDGGDRLPMPTAMREAFFQVGGPLLAGGLIAAGIRWSWPETPIIATVGLALMALLRFVDWWWERVPHYLFFLLVGGLAVATLLLLRVVRKRQVHAT